MQTKAYDAVDTVAMIAAARPDLFRQIMDSMDSSIVAAADPWTMAERVIGSAATESVRSPLDAVSSSFERYLRYRGRSARLACDYRKSLWRFLMRLGMEQILSAAECGDEYSLEDVVAFGRTIGLEPDVTERLIRLFAEFHPEYEASQKEWDFSYREIGPGSEGLAQAADLCGGRAAAVNGDPDLVIVNLPFSAFVGTTDEADPTVGQVIEVNRRLLNAARAVLFRVDWTSGADIGVSSHGYRRFLQASLPGFEFRSALIENARIIPMRGVEGFFAGAKGWTGKFEPVAVGRPVRSIEEVVDMAEGGIPLDPVPASVIFVPGQIPGRIAKEYVTDPSAAVVRGPLGPRRLLPQEVSEIMGLRHVHYEARADDEIYASLAETAPVAVAERAIRGLLRAT